MSSSFNQVIVIGRLGQDPDVRYTQSNTAVANLSVATTEKYKDKQGEWKEETEWHRVVFWGRTAEVCQEYLEKGSLIQVVGSLTTRKWENKEGNTRYTTEIKGRRMLMLDSKGESHTPSKAPNDSTPDIDEGFDDIDDDLPF